MSRCGYSEDGDTDEWATIRWRGQVTSAIRGKRGQAFLTELLGALDAMPEKRLIAGELEAGGEVCAIGSVGKKRGIDMSSLDIDNFGQIAETFGIAHQLVQEIEYMNDEGVGWYQVTPEQRWERVRKWVADQIRTQDAAGPQS
jgi:hypothetical protein